MKISTLTYVTIVVCVFQFYENKYTDLRYHCCLCISVHYVCPMFSLSLVGSHQSVFIVFSR